MDDDDAGRPAKEGRLEDFPRMDERGGEGTGGLRRGEFPGVKNLGTLKRTDICSSQCQDRHCFATGGDKLDFHRRAIGIAMDDRPDVAFLEAVFGHVARENDRVKFLDHRLLFEPLHTG
jgi:hypothetical protein